MSDGLSMPNPCPTPPKSKKGLKTHLKAIFDPAKPCKRIKDEIIAKELAKGSNRVDAIRKAYPKASYNSARSMTHVITQRGLEARALHILAEQGMTEGDLFKSLKECVLSSDERIKLDGTKHALGLIGYGKDQNIAEKSFSPVQINFIVNSNRETKQPNPNDTIEIDTK